jgi:SAM-dependent methyltransferase
MPYGQGAGTVVGMAHSHYAELLELDAEALRDWHGELLGWVAAAAPARARVIDLGSGTGTGALTLARLLPDAQITAVDVDEDLHEHVRRKARAAGLAGRVTTLHADLDQPWPALGPADLVWASNSLHHVADLDQALSRIRQTLRPGGILAVSEMADFPRFLPAGPEGDLEDHCHEALARIRAEEGMHIGADWAARLAAGGFTVEAERRFAIDLRPPLPPAAARFARASLQHYSRGLEDCLPPADLAALDAAAASAETRDDLSLRSSRTVWLARA